MRGFIGRDCDISATILNTNYEYNGMLNGNDIQVFYSDTTDSGLFYHVFTGKSPSKMTIFAKTYEKLNSIPSMKDCDYEFSLPRDLGNEYSYRNIKKYIVWTIMCLSVEGCEFGLIFEKNTNFGNKVNTIIAATCTGFITFVIILIVCIAINRNKRLEVEDLRSSAALNGFMENHPIVKWNSFFKADICGICFETFNKDSFIRRLDCQHVFDVNCIDKWAEIKLECPNCKEPLENMSNYI